ncbi:MAG: hypothetical protein NVS3B21_03240 [Acidimicrobiales bacterium]
MPWLHSPLEAVTELVRVTRPTGHIILSSDNRDRLTYLVDPLFSPGLARARAALGRFRRRRPIPMPGTSTVTERRYAPEELDTMLASAGLVPVRRQSVGFGAFTLLGHPFLSRRASLRTNDWLQRQADLGRWPMRGHANHEVMMFVRH